MAKDKLTDYDSVASSNLDVGGISVAEGMLPSGVNNAIREQMSHLADFAAGTSGVDVLKLQDDTDTNSIKLQAPASVTATTTFTLPDGDGASGQAMITDGAGTLSWAAPYGNRNLIINGAMQVWQRGVSQTVAGYGSVDRFQMSNSTSTFTVTRQAFTAGQTDVPNNPLYYLRCVVSSGGAAANYMFMSQGIEGVQTGAGQTVTLSFYAKASSALKVGISYQQLFGTSGSSTVSTNGVAVTLSTSWARYTVTTTLPSIASKTIGTASDMLRLLLWLDSGSTYNTTSGSIGNQSGTFEFSNIQLEVGDTATPFEHRSYGDELARCQRYYETGAIAFDGNQAVIFGSYSVTKRAAPSLTRTGNTYSGSEAGTFNSYTNQYFYVTSGSVYIGGGWTADAEL